MRIDLGGQCGHIGAELWERRGVAFGKQANAPGQTLPHRLELVADAGTDGGQPFVLDDEGAYIGGVQCGVFGICLRIECSFLLFDSAFECAFAFV